MPPKKIMHKLMTVIIIEYLEGNNSTATITRTAKPINNSVVEILTRIVVHVYEDVGKGLPVRARYFSGKRSGEQRSTRQKEDRRRINTRPPIQERTRHLLAHTQNSLPNHCHLLDPH